MKQISLASAHLPFQSYLNVFDCMWSKRLGRGKYIRLLEDKACEYFGVTNAIAVANGTLADYLILAALKAKVNDPKRNQVILPALTFVAHPNSVILAGLHPIFVDVEDDMQMNQTQAKEALNQNTLCVFPVHFLGAECKIPKFKVPVLQDCCEGMGGRTERGIFFGTRALAASFSMYPSHTITTGEGGIIITNDDEFAKIIRSIHDHGKTPGSIDFNFSHIGINAKITNLQAAIGCSVFDTIDEVNQKRRRNVEYFNKFFGANFYASSPHGYPVIYKNMNDRDEALELLAFKRIEARKLMSCIPNLKPYKALGYEAFNMNAQRIADCGLYLSCHQSLTFSELERITNVIPKP